MPPLVKQLGFAKMEWNLINVLVGAFTVLTVLSLSLSFSVCVTSTYSMLLSPMSRSRKAVVIWLSVLITLYCTTVTSWFIFV